MTTSRRTRALAAVGAALALTLAAPADAGGAAASKAATKPAVGECRSLTLAQASEASDTSAAIDCAGAHNDRVIAVPKLPRGVTYADLDTDATLTRIGTRLCYPAFRAAAGRDDRLRARSAYTWLFFVPTAQQRAGGARWLRCDLALRRGTTFADLPTDREPALEGSTVPAAVKRCLVGSTHLTTTCSATHGYRVTGSFTVDLKKFPGRQRMLQIGRNRCPALVSTDRSFLFSWTPRDVFDVARDRTMACYSRTSS